MDVPNLFGQTDPFRLRVKLNKTHLVALEGLTFDFCTKKKSKLNNKTFNTEREINRDGNRSATPTSQKEVLKWESLYF